MKCSDCKSTLEKYRTKYSKEYYKCNKCEKKFIYEYINGKRRLASSNKKYKFTERDVHEIFFSNELHTVIASKYKTNRQTVSLIKCGKSYVHWLPKNRDDRCTDCKHWNENRCGLGFPDPIEEGPRFAVHCAAFVKC